MTTHECSQLLLAHRVALMEVVNDVGTLRLATVQAVSLQAFHHLQLHRTAFVVVLSVDHRASQVSEGRAEERSDNGDRMN